jgi:hypothetical protein
MNTPGHEQIAADGAELAFGGELSIATIVARTDDKVVVAVEQAARAGGLQRPAIAAGRRPIAIDLAQRRARRKRVEHGHVLIERRGAVADAELSQQCRGGARLRVGTIAVDMLLPKLAVVADTLDRQRIGRLPRAGRLAEGELLMGGLRPSVHRRPSLTKELNRGGGGCTKIVIRAGEHQMEFSLLAFGAEIGVHAAKVAERGIVAPTMVLRRVCRRVDRPILVLHTGLHRGGLAAERADQSFHLGAVVGKPVLHVNRQGAADCIEAKDRVVRLQRHLVDGGFRDERPVHHVTVGFVDANPVLIDGNPLRCAGNRRCHEPAIVEILLKLIAGLIGQGRKRKAPRHRLQQIGCFGVIEILRP